MRHYYEQLRPGLLRQFADRWPYDGEAILQEVWTHDIPKRVKKGQRIDLPPTKLIAKIMHRRACKIEKREAILAQKGIPIPVAPEMPDETVLEREETRELDLRARAQLGPKRYAIADYTRRRGATFESTAAALGLSTQQVFQQQKRARIQLAQVYQSITGRALSVLGAPAAMVARHWRALSHAVRPATMKTAVVSTTVASLAGVGAIVVTGTLHHNRPGRPQMPEPRPARLAHSAPRYGAHVAHAAPRHAAPVSYAASVPRGAPRQQTRLSSRAVTPASITPPAIQRHQQRVLVAQQGRAAYYAWLARQEQRAYEQHQPRPSTNQRRQERVLLAQQGRAAYYAWLGRQEQRRATYHLATATRCRRSPRAAPRGRTSCGPGTR